MERQIKFRGISRDTGKWLVGALIPNGKKEAYIAPFGRCLQLEEVDPDSVGQFTGLLDKNGKEIYEGDRVNVLQAERNFDIVVKWSNEAMAFMACYADGEQSPFSWFTNLRIYQLTVIGNIHDNPSLISDKQ